MLLCLKEDREKTILYYIIDKTEKIDSIFAPPLQNYKNFGGFSFSCQIVKNCKIMLN